MFSDDDNVEKELIRLPEDIRKSVKSGGKEIRSIDELRELVRRIRDAESGKLN